jgi:hypothetical protein
MLEALQMIAETYNPDWRVIHLNQHKETPNSKSELYKNINFWSSRKETDGSVVNIDITE